MRNMVSTRILLFSPADLRRRGLLILGIFLFAAAFQLAYIGWLSPSFGYAGFEYKAPPSGYIAIAWLLSILPALWSPIALTRPSQLIYWILYLTVFIPSMFVPLYIALNPPKEVLQLMLAIFAGFCLIGLAYSLPLPRIKFATPSRSVYWAVFGVVSVSLVIWIVGVFRGSLHLVSFADVYELRYAADDIIAGSGAGYALIWLSSSINPLLMARGLVYGRKLLFVTGVCGQLLGYSAAGSKSMILSILAMTILYALLRRSSSGFALQLVWGVVLCFGTLYSLAMISGLGNSPLVFYALSITFMRTFGFPGMLSAQYYDFFQVHPNTYFSHVHGINLLVHYPYQEPLGIEIGHHYVGYFNVNWNAHFWATDGIAGIGLTGVLGMSLICCLVFWLLDTAASGHRPAFAALSLTFVALNISNTSLFTTFLSGGMLLSMILLLLLPRDAVVRCGTDVLNLPQP
ncbi:MAG: hypothetical protein JWN45_2695 [Acidobacteriaceae bacterium]|nr:hypothetical protein [Acidobacteriaceae bacterium]